MRFLTIWSLEALLSDSVNVLVGVGWGKRIRDDSTIEGPCEEIGI